MRIDAHHHFLEPSRFHYPWLGSELEILHREFNLAMLRPSLACHNIRRTVLVQTISSVEETRHFLELGRSEPEIAGVVGWVDLTDPDVGHTLDDLQQQGPLVGIRHQVHDESDRDWLARKDVRRGLKALAEREMVYDLLIRPEHLRPSLELARNLTELSLVVDHIAKPNIRQRSWHHWASGLAELAQCPNVTCKLSGMITEAKWDHWCPEDLYPYVDHTVGVFSPERVMFGSDWPVCLLAGSYDQVISATEAGLAALDITETQQQEIFGGTAARIYQLHKAKP